MILGCGYTGERVARLVEGEVLRVRAHEAEGCLRFDVLDASTHAALAEAVKPGARVLYSLPVLRTEAGYRATAGVVVPLLAGRAARVVYLSTTGVYGDAGFVDETTPAAPRNERERLRVEEERAVMTGPWSAMVLRPAAIYGPGRGVQESMRTGRYKLPGDGSNFISRIHVDDLAEHCVRALESDVEGVYPVADEEACEAREIAAYCARLLGVAMPEFTERLPEDDTRRSNRRVDGRAVRRLLGVTLRYPGYREGIAASLR